MGVGVATIETKVPGRPVVFDEFKFVVVVAGLDLSFAGSQGEYHCMWRCPRPGLNPSGLVKNSSLATGPQFTEMKIL